MPVVFTAVPLMLSTVSRVWHVVDVQWIFTKWMKWFSWTPQEQVLAENNRRCHIVASIKWATVYKLTRVFSLVTLSKGVFFPYSFFECCQKVWLRSRFLKSHENCNINVAFWGYSVLQVWYSMGWYLLERITHVISLPPPFCLKTG